MPLHRQSLLAPLLYAPYFLAAVTSPTKTLPPSHVSSRPILFDCHHVLVAAADGTALGHDHVALTDQYGRVQEVTDHMSQVENE